LWDFAIETFLVSFVELSPIAQHAKGDTFVIIKLAKISEITVFFNVLYPL
jgi:hypothetical protein